MTVVAVCQVALSVGELAANRAAAADAVTAAAEGGARLVVLPELCDSGYVFTGAGEALRLAEPAGASHTLQQWRALAARHDVVIAGGFCELGDDGRLYNSAALVDASGTLAVYRKAHLWDAEKLVFTPGAEAPPVTGLPFGNVALMMGYAPSPANEKALRRIIQENPHHEVQGKANYALGQILKNEKKQKAAEQEFETVAAKFSDVKMGKRTLADLANGELFEIRHLSIGKVAPNIVGTDADGKKFQLTDYR